MSIVQLHKEVMFLLGKWHVAVRRALIYFIF